MWSLRPEHFKMIYTPRPPPEEQAAVVRFLDYANGRLERAIRAKRKVIALLHEQKQAIIHRAVTRGLDPTVPLKPSGIPWLGDIPKHWDVRRLKSLGTKFGSGVTPRGGAAVYQESGVPLLRSQNVHFGELRLDLVARISRNIHNAMAGTHVQPGDVLLNITGASIGRACAVPEHVKEANVNQHVCIIRPIKKRCDSEYLATYLATEAAQTAIYIAQNGSSREGLPVSEVKALPIVLPPVAEQVLIGQWIQKETEVLRTAINRLEREISLLREYRTRLVADVVTGKLDVRPAARQLPAEPVADVPMSEPDDSVREADLEPEAAHAEE
jgi:type I restriction enzyme S subunit